MSIRKLVCTAILTIALAATAAPARAQTTPTVFTFCYMPSVGAVYRIKAADTPDSCRSPRHVEFSWTDGVPGGDHGALNGLSDDDHPEYVREGESAAGDLSGTYPGPTVQALRGQSVAAVTPTEGQVLAFSGGAWTPATPAASGISFNDLLGLDGAGSGLDADLLDGQEASAFAAAAHDHDGRYYTETESDARYVSQSAAPAGDLAGTYPAPVVSGLRGRPISDATPASGQVLAWDGSAWKPAASAAPHLNRKIEVSVVSIPPSEWTQRTWVGDDLKGWDSDVDFQFPEDCYRDTRVGNPLGRRVYTALFSAGTFCKSQNGFAAAEVTCDAGTTLVGGGARISFFSSSYATLEAGELPGVDGGHSVALVSNGPTSILPGDTWRAAAVDTRIPGTGPQATLYVYGICVSP